MAHNFLSIFSPKTLLLQGPSDQSSRFVTAHLALSFLVPVFFPTKLQAPQQQDGLCCLLVATPVPSRGLAGRRLLGITGGKTG